MPDPVDGLRNPREAKNHFLKYLKYELFTLNFYRAHMLYFIIVIAISSVIVYGEGVKNGPKEYRDSHLSYMDALFLTCSAMTTTVGLNSVNLGDLSSFQQAVLCILLIIGNIPFVSMVVVLIRQSMFRKRMSEVVKHSRTMQRLVQDIEDNRQTESSGNSSNNNLRQRQVAGGRKSRVNGEQKPAKTQPLNKRKTFHHQTGFGFVPTPWETQLVKNFFKRVFDSVTSELKPEQHDYVSFKPRLDSKGRFLKLSEHDRLELGGVEYRALQALLYILIGYQLFWYTFGVVFLVPYAYCTKTRDILREAQPGGLNPGWWAFFSTVTEFANGGLNVLNANFIPFSGMPYILIIAGALALIGQTQFPIFLRLTIWMMKKCVPKGSRLHNTLQFLLQHPRRCFIYLFPSRQTWYLLAIQITIDINAWLCFEILNIGMLDIETLPTGTRTLDGLFQATGLRTSGAYIIAFSSLAPACLVAYLVIMYISSYPLVMTLRKTNTYEERSIGLDEGDDSAAGIASHLQKQLAYDIWFQFLAFFLVSIIERGHILRGDPGFDSFAVLFEVTSAYGTVGLSTGVPGEDYSLSGSFASLSKVVMLFVMVRGRHRGLPLAIDRSILLPGEELMQRLDAEYGGRGGASAEDLQELITNIEESGAQTGGSKSAAAQQDP
ncbi:potassium transport protein-like protein 1 [Macroventuria anomochaeta]|uniref:Potassium transport protein-like protein 1 n=1 Tax=Macroventuria anomochaeta TaxID=301207 RepID=A0ACB6RP86_9PLEO|nr:potassium transport protein-like protein 1 [Macroventuria anomochaeta]KAF2623097.1 potassium transport protein-like protein 1 [Macroventuria anomochaeta]